MQPKHSLKEKGTPKNANYLVLPTKQLGIIEHNIFENHNNLI